MFCLKELRVFRLEGRFAFATVVKEALMVLNKMNKTMTFTS